MTQQRISSQLDWILKVDPAKVYDVLAGFAGASNSEQTKNTFVSCWNSQNWHEWHFGGNLGAGGKCWREKRYVPGEGYVPCLRVDCRSEHDNKKIKAVISKTNDALLDILISSGLRNRIK